MGRGLVIPDNVDIQATFMLMFWQLYEYRSSTSMTLSLTLDRKSLNYKVILCSDLHSCLPSIAFCQGNCWVPLWRHLDFPPPRMCARACVCVSNNFAKLVISIYISSSSSSKFSFQLRIFLPLCIVVHSRQYCIWTLKELSYKCDTVLLRDLNTFLAQSRTWIIHRQRKNQFHL